MIDGELAEMERREDAALRIQARWRGKQVPREMERVSPLLSTRSIYHVPL